MDDERERFQESLQLMKESFVLVKDQLERAGWGASVQNDTFFDGYEKAKQVFGDVLLQRDVKTIFHTEGHQERSNPEGGIV